MSRCYDSPYSLKDCQKFKQPIVNIKSFGLIAFRYEGTKILNELATHIKDAYDPNDFKAKIWAWLSKLYSAV